MHAGQDCGRDVSRTWTELALIAAELLALAHHAPVDGPICTMDRAQDVALSSWTSPPVSFHGRAGVLHGQSVPYSHEDHLGRASKICDGVGVAGTVNIDLHALYLVFRGPA